MPLTATAAMLVVEMTPLGVAGGGDGRRVERGGGVVARGGGGWRAPGALGNLRDAALGRAGWWVNGRAFGSLLAGR